MLYKSQFQIDIAELKFTKEPERIIEFQKKKMAADIGRLICEKIPFEINKDKSVRRELVNTDSYPQYGDAPYETYETEIFAVSARDWFAFRKKVDALRIKYIEADIIMDYLKELEMR